MKGNLDLSHVPIDKLPDILALYYPETLLGDAIYYDEDTDSYNVKANDSTLRVFSLNPDFQE